MRFGHGRFQPSLLECQMDFAPKVTQRDRLDQDARRCGFRHFRLPGVLFPGQDGNAGNRFCLRDPVDFFKSGNDVTANGFSHQHDTIGRGRSQAAQSPLEIAENQYTEAPFREVLAEHVLLFAAVLDAHDGGQRPR